MKNKFLKRRSSGFTLIELVVVIAIIGIVSSIAIPNFLVNKKDAMLKADQISAHNITMAINTELNKGTKVEDISKYGYKIIADTYFDGVMPKSQSEKDNFTITVTGSNVIIATSAYKLYPQFEQLNN